MRGLDLSMVYGEGATRVDALRGVDVDFAAGSFTAIIGPSGSGKSTLLHILAGLEQPTSRWVEIAGTRLGDLSDREPTLLRRRSIGFVFQSYNLLPVLTAEENVTLPVKIGSGDVDRPWLETLISSMALEERRGHRPSEMSGGEQQRVAVGHERQNLARRERDRAVMSSPRSAAGPRRSVGCSALSSASGSPRS